MANAGHLGQRDDEGAEEMTVAGRASAGTRIVATSTLTNLADGVLRLLLPLLALDAGASPFAVSVIVAAALAPWLFGSLFAGALVDRARRSTILLRANSIRGLVLWLLFVLILTGTPTSPAVLAVMALACGTAEVFADLSLQSAVPQLVPDAALEKIYSRVAVVQDAGNTLVGPAAGGLLYAFSPSLLTALVATSYLASLPLVPRTPPGARVPGPRLRALRKEIGEGVNAIRRDSWLLRVSIAVGAMNFASGASTAVFITYAVAPGPLNLTPAQFGALLAAAGLGAVAGGLMSSRLSRRLGARACLLIGAAALILNIAAPGVTQDVLHIALLTTACSAAGMLFGVQVIATRQRRVAPDLRGRVNAAFQLIGIGSAPLGALAGGALAGAVGQRPIFLMFAGFAGLVMLVVRPWKNRERSSGQARTGTASSTPTCSSESDAATVPAGQGDSAERQK